jgi:sugar lactone lactonase YvrE
MTRELAAEVVLDIGSAHGEGPVWHQGDRRLDWVDIGAGCCTASIR